MTYYKNNPSLTPIKMNKNLDKKTNELLSNLNKMPSLEQMGVDGARKFVAKAQADIPQDLSGAEVTEHTIAGVKAYYCELENKKETDTVLVFVHGGGGTLSHWSDYQRMVRDIVVQSGIPCVFPEYALAPEAKYPTQINEYVDVCKELHSRQLKLALVGNSFGGAFTDGFNMSEGGKGSVGAVRSDEHRTRISKSMTGKVKDEAHRLKIQRSMLMRDDSDKRSRIAKIHSKPILQYTMNGELVREWESATVAAKSLGLDSTSIRKNCTGTYRSSQGYVWKEKAYKH